MLLTDLKKDQKAYITDIKNEFNFIKRLTAIGIGINHEIELKFKAPLNGPYYISTNNRQVIMRRSDTKLIEVAPIN